MGMFDLSEIQMSKNDERRGLKLPERMTPELAEDVGIMAGDGHISIQRRPLRTDYEISCYGHAITDRLFMQDYVKSLKFKLFNLHFSMNDNAKDTTCRLRTRSMGLVYFYSNIIGLPSGSKHNISIPKTILCAKEDVRKCFLRGLADTDFTLVFKDYNKGELNYPLLKISTSSKNLVLGLKDMLSSLGFKPSVCCDMKAIHTKTLKPFTTHQLCLNGRKNLAKWMEEIGFSNPKNVLRYRTWKENGSSLPNSEIERIMSGPGGI